jgi:hypothetical protein
MHWSTWRWVLGAVCVVAIVAGTAGWGLLDASCGSGTGSQGQTTAESFSCDGAGYLLLAAWGLGSLALTAIVAAEFIRRIRDDGDDDDEAPVAASPPPPPAVASRPRRGDCG